MRIFVAASLVLAVVAAVFLGVLDGYLGRVMARRDVGFDDLRPHSAPGGPEAEALLREAASALRCGSARLRGLSATVDDEVEPRIVMLSVCDGSTTAHVAVGRAHGMRRAVERALEALVRSGEAVRPDFGVRLDVVVAADPACPSATLTATPLVPGFDGIAFAAPERAVLLPEVLTVRGLVAPSGHLRPERMASFGSPTGDPSPLLHRFRCVSYFLDGDKVYPLFHGTRRYGILRMSDFLDAARRGARFLASRALGPQGRFVEDAIEPAGGAGGEVATDVHARAVIAILETYAISGDRDLLAAADAPLASLRRVVREGAATPEPSAENAGEEAPGADDAVWAALALLVRMEVTGDRADLDLVRTVARGLEPGDLLGGGGGAALLALVRLARMDPEGGWLAAAEAHAANALLAISARAGAPIAEGVDPTELRGLGELDRRVRDDARAPIVIALGDAIVAGQNLLPQCADDLGSWGIPARSDTTAERAAALLAAYRVARDAGDAAAADRFLESVCLSVLFQLRVQVLPESAMFRPCPARSSGGFRIGLRDAEPRIATTAGNVDSLLALHRLLREERRDGVGRVPREIGLARPRR